MVHLSTSSDGILYKHRFPGLAFGNSIRTERTFSTSESSVLFGNSNSCRPEELALIWGPILSLVHYICMIRRQEISKMPKKICWGQKLKYWLVPFQKRETTFPGVYGTSINRRVVGVILRSVGPIHSLSG